MAIELIKCYLVIQGTLNFLHVQFGRPMRVVYSARADFYWRVFLHVFLKQYLSLLSQTVEVVESDLLPSS